MSESLWNTIGNGDVVTPRGVGGTGGLRRAGLGIALAVLCAGLAPAEATAAGAALTILHSFNDGIDQDGQQPVARLIEHDGKFYGTTYLGGDDQCGTIFSITAGGEFERLHSMIGGQHGCQIPSGLTAGPDDALYGVAQLFGPAPGIGTAFKITAAGDFSHLHSFGGVGNPAAPYGALLLGDDGNFYGTTSSGGSGPIGTVYRMTPAGAVTTLHSFNGLLGAGPRAALVEGPDGALYGTTPVFGDCEGAQCGTIFRITADDEYELVHAFTAAGEIPSGLVLGPEGDRLYGMIDLGGFAGGFSPGGLTLGDDGNFYAFLSSAGTTLFSITPEGDYDPIRTYSFNDTGIVRITPAGDVTVLVSITDLTLQGLNMVGFLQGGFIQGSDGHLYGVSRFGGDGECEGSAGCGTVFRVALNDDGGGDGDGDGNGNGNGNGAASGGGGGGALNPGLLMLLAAAALRRRYFR